MMTKTNMRKYIQRQLEWIQKATTTNPKLTEDVFGKTENALTPREFSHLKRFLKMCGAEEVLSEMLHSEELRDNR